MRLWEKQKNRKNLAEKLGCQSSVEDQIDLTGDNIYIQAYIYSFPR